MVSVMSEPLDRALQITGKIQVKLWVSSDCEDTAFTAKLMRVTPDGQAYNIRSSITTIGQGSIAGENYKPEQQTQVTIDMWDVCYTVRAGERIRLDISSSDYPNFHVHCNYKGVWGEQKNSVSHIRACTAAVRQLQQWKWRSVYSSKGKRADQAIFYLSKQKKVLSDHIHVSDLKALFFY